MSRSPTLTVSWNGTPSGITSPSGDRNSSGRMRWCLLAPSSKAGPRIGSDARRASALTGIDRVSHFLWIGVESNDRYPEHLRLSESERAAVAAGTSPTPEHGRDHPPLARGRRPVARR